jgi:Family of unknown function (DUF6130)
MRIRFKNDLCVMPIGTLPAAAARYGARHKFAVAQIAREVRGASPCVAIENEPAPKLIVDQPLAVGPGHGVFWVQYRLENVRIAQVLGGERPQRIPR